MTDSHQRCRLLHTVPDFLLASIFGTIRNLILLLHPYERGMMKTSFVRIHIP
jgi:hypothetical protein